jgi:hypothetical protein
MTPSGDSLLKHLSSAVDAEGPSGRMMGWPHLHINREMGILLKGCSTPDPSIRTNTVNANLMIAPALSGSVQNFQMSDS